MLSFFNRLDIYMEYKGLNDNQITIEAGISNGIIGKGRKRGTLSQDNISKILHTYSELNANWLFTGEGEMLNGDNAESKVKSSKPNISIYKLMTDYFNENQQIPLYELDSAAGLTTLFDTQVHHVPLDYISVPNAPKCDGAIYVRGDSMYPILKSGDILCYKTIREIENIHYGDIHLLDLEVEGDRQLMVKYIQTSKKGDDYVTLVSHNDHYAPRDIHKSQIMALALVKLSIRYNTIS